MKNNINNEKMIITLDDLVEDFGKQMKIGVQAVKSAAQIFVTAISKYGEKARARFSLNFPEISRNVWKMLEDIGRGKLPPQAYMMSAGAIAKLREAQIPTATMNKVAVHKVQVFNPLTKKGNDIQFTDLTERQAEQLFDPETHAIRTLDQQKQYLAAQRPRVMVEARSVPPISTNIVPPVAKKSLPSSDVVDHWDEKDEKLFAASEKPVGGESHNKPEPKQKQVIPSVAQRSEPPATAKTWDDEEENLPAVEKNCVTSHKESKSVPHPAAAASTRRVAPPTEQKPYVVLSDGILFMKSAKVTFAELREILAKKERGEI